MPYYCQIAKSLEHVSPAVSILLNELENLSWRNQLSILDVGCGNARNSLTLFRRFGGRVVLLDADPTMLLKAHQNFVENGFPNPEIINSRVEDFAVNHNLPDESFDVVILSYILQHAKPDSYHSIVDFCQKMTRRYCAIDVYWNPSRCKIGELVQKGSISWYGISYEELLRLVAPRFRIARERTVISRTNSYITISLLCTPGKTSLPEAAQELDYQALMDGAALRRRRPRIHQPSELTPAIDRLPSLVALAKFYPQESQAIATGMGQLAIDNPEINHSKLIKAAYLLTLCRTLKLPILVDEIASDFRIPANKLLWKTSDLGPIERLAVHDYAERIIRMLQLDEKIRDATVSEIAKRSVLGKSPAVIAATAVFLACQKQGINIPAHKIARAVSVTPASIRNSLKSKVYPESFKDV